MSFLQKSYTRNVAFPKLVSSKCDIHQNRISQIYHRKSQTQSVLFSKSISPKVVYLKYCIAYKRLVAKSVDGPKSSPSISSDVLWLLLICYIFQNRADKSNQIRIGGNLFRSEKSLLYIMNRSRRRHRVQDSRCVAGCYSLGAGGRGGAWLFWVPLWAATKLLSILLSIHYLLSVIVSIIYSSI